MTQSGGRDELPDDLPEDQVPGAPPTPAAGSGGSGAPDASSVKGSAEKRDELSELPDGLPGDLVQEDVAAPASDSAAAYAQAHRDHQAVALEYATRGSTQGAASTPAAISAAAARGAIPIDYAPVAVPFRRLTMLIALVIVGFLLWYGEPILVPLAISVLLSFLLSPLCEWMERRRVPRVASVVLVVMGAFMVLGALGWGVFNAVHQLGNNIETIGDNLEKKIERLPFRGSGGMIEKATETIEKLEEAGDATDVAGGDEMALVEENPTPSTQPLDVPAPAGATQAATTAATQQTQSDQLLLASQKWFQALSERLQANEQAALQREREATEAAQRAATRPARGSDAEAPIFVTEIPRAMTPVERAGFFLGLIAGPLGAAGLVIIFTLFILLQRDDLRDRLITLAAGQQLNLATQALDDAATRISKYLVAQAIVNGTYGLAVGIGLQVIALLLTEDGFPSVWLWALLCAALRFIPYLGPWLAAAFPIFVSIGFYDDYSMFFATAGYFVVIELLSNNVMEPILYGSSTGMSPVAVILAAAFWTLVWGPIGLLVATPLTTCLVVLGKYVPALRFFDTLLGDEPVLAPDQRLYQRMLALDAEDAEDVVEAYRKDHSLTETFDAVLLPALALAERDRHAGHLTVERIDFIRVAMREIVEELARQTEPSPSDSVDLTSTADPAAPAAPAASVPALPNVQARVVVIPSVDAADKTAACMLKALLDRRGFEVNVLDEEELTSEKLEQVFEQQADVAVISAVPPRAVARARYLVKRLRLAQSQRGQADAGTAATMVVGLWTVKYDTQRATDRVKGQGPDLRVVTSMAEAVEEVRQRAQVGATRRASAHESSPKPSAPSRVAQAGSGR